MESLYTRVHSLLILITTMRHRISECRCKVYLPIRVIWREKIPSEHCVTSRPHCNAVVPWQLNARTLPHALFEIQFDDSDTECWYTDVRWVSAAINSKPFVFATARVELDRCIRFASLTSYTCACNILRVPLPAFLLLSYRLSCSVSKLLKSARILWR